MKLCSAILKNLGIRRDLGMMSPNKSFCHTPEFLLGKEKGDKNEEQVILFRIMYEKRKSYNCLSLHFYQRRNLFNYDDTVQFSTEYIRTCSLTKRGFALSNIHNFWAEQTEARTVQCSHIASY